MIGPRFSIIPARAILNKSLTDLDIRILGILGIHADRSGWCFKNQSKIAEELDVTRRAVNRSIARLASEGLIEKKEFERAKGKSGLRSINTYRILFDDDAGPQQETIEALSPEGDGGDVLRLSDLNGSTLGLQGLNSCDPTVSTVGTPGSQLNVPLLTIPLEQSKTPLPPKGDDAVESLPLEDLEVKPAKKPAAKSKRKPKTGAPAYTGKFQEAWLAFPERTGMSKAKAFQSWQEQGCEEIADIIIAAVKAFAVLVAQKKRQRPDFSVKHMQGWLTERRWEAFEEAEMEPVPVSGPAAEPERVEEADGMRIRDGRVEFDEQLEASLSRICRGQIDDLKEVVRIAVKKFRIHKIRENIEALAERCLVARTPAIAIAQVMGV